MEIDVMGWIKKSLKPSMVEEGSALKGRDTPILDPIPRHTVLGLPLDEVPEGCEVTYFAMGCYWGEERLFWRQDGVVNTAVGFMGGFTPNPTYRESCGGQTGHAETVQVVFDPKQVSFTQLLAVFWENHDPTQGARQGNDVGTEYRSAIFPTNDAQLEAAKKSRDSYQEKMTAAGYGTITTEITPDLPFYYAEKEHQQYLDKNPGGYCPVHSTGVACD